MHPRLRKTFLSAALLMAAVLVYLRVWNNDFLNWDDPLYVTLNRTVGRGFTWSGIAWAFTTFHAANWHPLTWLSHMLDVELYGMNAAGHHASSVILHALTCVMLFLMLQRTSGRIWPSFFVAGVFAVHPVHVESVAWVAERKDVLSALYGMLTLWFYVLYAQKQARRYYLLSLAMLALGLMAKPMLVTLPCVMLLLDFWPLRRTRFLAANVTPKGQLSAQSDRSIRFLLMEKVPFLALAAASSVVTYLAQAEGEAVVTLAHLDFATRLNNALFSYLRYIGKILWPAKLAVFYPYWREMPAWIGILCALVLLAISALAIAQARRRPYLIVGWLWFLGTLAPVIGIVQVGSQALADRYLYFPMVGLLVTVAWGKTEWLSTPHRIRAAAALAGAAIIALGVRTWIETGYWKDGKTLFTRALQVTRDSPTAHGRLGAAYAADAEVLLTKTQNEVDPQRLRNLERQRQELLQQAIFQYEAALKLSQDNPDRHRELALALIKTGELDRAGEHLAAAQALRPDHWALYSVLAEYSLARGDLHEAIDHYQTAVRLNPRQTLPLYNLAVLQIKASRADEAITTLRRYLKQEPNDAEAHYHLGMLLKVLDVPQALEHFRKSVAIQPGSAQVQVQLGLMLAGVGRGKEAIAPMRRALELEPENPLIMQNLAWILATHPDARVRNGPDAVALAQRANEISGQRNGEVMDTLAAALAQQGRFSEATEYAEKSLELLKESGKDELIRQIEARLMLYRQGKSYLDRSLRERSAVR